MIPSRATQVIRIEVNTVTTQAVYSQTAYSQAAYKQSYERSLSDIDSTTAASWHSPTLFSVNESAVRLPKLATTPNLHASQATYRVAQTVQKIIGKSNTLAVPQLELPAMSRHSSNNNSNRGVLKTPANESERSDDEKEIYSASMNKSELSKASKSTSDHKDKLAPPTLSPPVQEEKADERDFAKELKEFLLPLCEHVNNVFGDVLKNNYIDATELRFFKYLFALTSSADQEKCINEMTSSIIKDNEMQETAKEIIRRFLVFHRLNRSKLHKGVRYKYDTPQEPSAPPVVVPLAALACTQSSAQSSLCQGCCIIM